MRELVPMFLVACIVVAAVLVGGPILIDRINEGKIMVAEFEYKTELARMDHEARMYTLHMGTWAGVINLALVLGAGLFAFVVGLVALYVFDPTGARRLKRRVRLLRPGDDESWPIIDQ